jgi:hypothetical protein
MDASQAGQLGGIGAHGGDDESCHESQANHQSLAVFVSGRGMVLLDRTGAQAQGPSLSP